MPIREEDLTDEQVKQATAKHLTSAQMRRIWATGRELGYDNDMIYAVVYGVTMVTSISALSKEQAAKVIHELEVRAGRIKRPRDNNSPGRLSVAQLDYIRGLERALKWDDNPDRLNGYCKRITGCEKVEWLAIEEASKLIVALREMIGYEAKGKDKGGEDSAPELDQGR